MKIAFASTNMNFCGAILEELQAHHTVKVWKWTRDKDIDMPNLIGLINWADLVYVDFIQHPLPWITRQQWLDKPVIARMDGLDILEHVNVDWTKVKALVLMPVQEKRLLRLREAWHKANPGKQLTKLPRIRLRRNVGIDLELFKPNYERKFEYKICLHSSVIRPTKRVYTAIQCFYELMRMDHTKPWQLTIIGQWEGGWAWPQRREYVMATRELIDETVFPPGRLGVIPQNLPREKWAQYLRDEVDIYWCTSFREGFPNSMGEACASGVYPLSNWWLGAELIYPEENLCRTPSELVRKTIDWGNEPVISKRLMKEASRKNIEKYSRRKAAVNIRELCEAVVR